jgi:hypothetical protein
MNPSPDVPDNPLADPSDVKEVGPDHTKKDAPEDLVGDEGQASS